MDGGIPSSKDLDPYTTTTRSNPTHHTYTSNAKSPQHATQATQSKPSNITSSTLAPARHYGTNDTILKQYGHVEDCVKNLQGTDGQDADLTAAAGQAARPTAAAAADAAVEGATASSMTGAQDEAVLTDAQQLPELPRTRTAL